MRIARRMAVLALPAALGSGLAAADGAAVFAEHCVACHQPGGFGAPGIAPPLAGTLGTLAGTESGRLYLSQILVSGMTGRIESQGITYNGNMPSFAALPDERLAEVMGHVLGEFNRDALPAAYTPLSAADFARARQRGLAAKDVKPLRQAAREGK